MKILLYIVLTIVGTVCILYLLFMYPERCQKPTARSLATLNAIKTISVAVDTYEKYNSSPPESLDVLVPDYIKKVHLSSWYFSIQYNPSLNKDSRVFSLGSDGKEGGIGAASDLYRYIKSSDLIHSISKPIWGCNA